MGAGVSRLGSDRGEMLFPRARSAPSTSPKGAGSRSTVPGVGPQESGPGPGPGLPPYFPTVFEATTELSE